MALKLTVESFLQVVRQSGLIDKDQLQKLLQQYEARGLDVKKSQVVADALVGDEIITRWQADKLLAGKHKGFTLGKYKLLGLLGKGGMSSVYLAEHVLMRRRCAIKVLPSQRVNDSSYLARFHREAQAVASVDHPNIVRAYDVDCAQDRDSQIHFLVMEYVQGQSLQELIISNGPAEYADAVEYVRQAAEGLEHAHRAGLVHRDIKPANILIDLTGVIKILDMGLARFFDDRDQNPLTVAHDEKVLGTADYLSPEQALDSHTVDARADIYSLGCSLYFFLTGHPPFSDGTLTQRLMWHQTKAFPSLTESRLDCPPSLMALLGKMVEKNPDDRYPSAAAVAIACRQWLADNAGTEWQERHLPVAPSGSDLRSAAPLRDLKSDSAMRAQGGSHVMGSSVSTRNEPDSSVTKISRPGSAPTVQPPTPPTKVALVSPPEMPNPVTVPSSNPPQTAMPVAPVAPPIARPVANPVPPIARPVVPVAMPVTVTPVAETKTSIKESVTSGNQTTELQFGSDAANDATVLLSPTTGLEPDTAGDLFSLFAGHDEPPTQDQPAAAPIADALPVEEPERTPEFSFAEPLTAEPAEVSPTLAETILFATPADTPPDFGEREFDAHEAVTPAPARPSPAKSLATKPNKALLYAAIAVVAVLAIGGIGWWSTRGKSSGGNSVANPKENGPHEVTLHVGAGGEFKSIARALYSAVEGRAEYEAAAKGKPLRFIVTVQPGQSFDESLALDESFPGELHLKSAIIGKNITLKSPDDEPAISIKNLSGATIEDVFIDLSGFPPKETGIVVSGSAARCRIKNSIISRAGKSGIELHGAAGGEGSDGIAIESVTFQNGAPTAFGVHIVKPSDGSPTQRATLQRCRFIGSMAAAVFVEGSVESLTIQNCGMSGTTSGVRFAAGVVAKKVLVDHCSFRNQTEAGLLFDAMPGASAGDFAWRNCLFSGGKKAELVIAKDYDENIFSSLMSAKNPVANNWSDRAAENSVKGERDLLDNGGSRASEILFESTNPNSELFLVSKAGEPYKTAGVKAK